MCEKSQWRETVLIRLDRQGLVDKRAPYFVQWNQLDCQYVEKTELPCRLHVDMFVDEIRKIEDRRRNAAEGL